MRRQPQDRRSAFGRSLMLANALAVLLASAVPASARAAKSCVAPNANCGGAAVASIVQALRSAAASSDSAPVVTTSAPSIAGLRADPAVFAVASRGTALAALSRRGGTHFGFTLSGASGWTITIQRTLPGRRRGAMCVAPSSQLRHTVRCTRSRTVGRLMRTGAKGTGTYLIAFTGRIGGRALPPGTYQATIRATGANGAQSVPRFTRFRIVKT